MRANALQILLVDDNADIRQALCSILHDCPDVRVVGEATNGKEAVFTAEKLQPDVVLMDVNIPKHKIRTLQWSGFLQIRPMTRSMPWSRQGPSQ
ncbi:MAG: TRAP-type C4-dicarboxylate transporter, periplasmic solute-binding protein [Nitrospira sp.]|nr:TRAP-type C4-dicarboxylate transporter, periplasmic solute-binding protein [Nitrospira sp.]